MQTQIVEETIHISFKEKKKDLNQNIHDLEDDLENLSLNNKSQSQNSLQIAMKESDEEMANDLEPSMPHHVFDDIPEDFEASPHEEEIHRCKRLESCISKSSHW